MDRGLGTQLYLFEEKGNWLIQIKCQHAKIGTTLQMHIREQNVVNLCTYYQEFSKVYHDNSFLLGFSFKIFHNEMSYQSDFLIV